jgi:hypothetical protein
MRLTPHVLSGLAAILVVACGTAATSPPDSGTADPDAAAATGGAQGTGGRAQGTGGVPGTGGGAQGTGGVQGTGGGAQGTGGVQGTGGRATSTGGVTGTGGGGGGGGGGGSVALSFRTDIWPVFSQMRQPPFVYRGAGSYSGCTAASPCHGSASPGARLSLRDADTAYAALVNVASTTSLCAGTVRVIPGDPARSCLILFYQGRLKDDLQWVEQAEIELVRRWIAEGARP